MPVRITSRSGATATDADTETMKHARRLTRAMTIAQPGPSNEGGPGIRLYGSDTAPLVVDARALHNRTPT